MRFHSAAIARWAITLGIVAALALVYSTPAAAQPAAQSKPNIVIIWGDDIGQSDISAYSMGVDGL